jgi:hypothetical protein
VIPAIWEAEAGGSLVGRQPGQPRKTPSRKEKENKIKRTTTKNHNRSIAETHPCAGFDYKMTLQMTLALKTMLMEASIYIK